MEAVDTRLTAAVRSSICEVTEKAWTLGVRQLAVPPSNCMTLVKILNLLDVTRSGRSTALPPHPCVYQLQMTLEIESV